MLIGIDAGGTSTRAVILDRTGRCLGFGTGGGGNPVALGPAQAGRGIRDAVESAMRQTCGRGAGGSPLPGAQSGPGAGGIAVLAMAGASSFVAPGAMAASVREFSGVDYVDVVSDLIAMFAAGGPEESGYVLVSGTGAAALRVEDGTVAAAADGLGWLLGDAGSGFWIGHRAVRAGLGALSGHGPATAIAQLLREDLGLPPDDRRTPRGRLMAVETAIDTFYQMQPIELSRFASLVFRAAKIADPGESGDRAPAGFDADADPVAKQILSRATELLVQTLASVRVPEMPGPVVFGGTVARRLPGLVEAAQAAFEAAGAPTPSVRIAADGTVGAAVLTLRAAGVVVDQEIFDRISTTLHRLRR